MLGVYLFNDILFYLNDNNYENIYNLDNLKIHKEKPCVYHDVYNFYFNHDFKYINNEITNYDICKNRFDIKIKNFREMLQNENMCIFITFKKTIDEFKINDMVNFFNNNKKKFHLMIFTTEDLIYDNIPNVSIIKIEQSFDKWFVMPLQKKIFLYKEIYNKFINTLRLNNIVHSFPEKFENTYYFISNIELIIMTTTYFLENFDQFLALNPFNIFQNLFTKTSDEWGELGRQIYKNNHWIVICV
jgi:hypothetical protein